MTYSKQIQTLCVYPWFQTKTIFLTLFFVFLAINTTYAQTKEPSFVWSLTGADYQRGNIHFPAYIANVRLSDYPIVGEAVVLEIEITSGQNEPDLKLDLELSEQIEVVEGDAHWHGSLLANESYYHTVIIIVKEKGFYHLNFGLLSPPSKAKSYIDGVSLFIESGKAQARIIRGHELQVTQSEYR